jgi:outer membrane protein TolC
MSRIVSFRPAACVFACYLAFVSPTSSGQELSLGEAQAVALRAAPQLLGQSAAVRAAREARIGASELPDPKLIAGIDNLPIEGGDKFSLTRDFMTMRKVGVMQDFPREEKRRLRGERADAEIRREEAVLAVSEVNLQRDVALAWVEAWSAEQQLRSLEGLAREAQLNVTAAEAALAGGRGSAADPFAARLAAEQLADRMIEARRLATRAREQLARWIGRDASRPLGDAPDFTRLVHDHDDLLGRIDAHPHLAMYEPMQAMAETDVRLAEAAKRPDWSVELAYAQRGSAYTNMLSINARIDLPIFEARRQAPAIASKLAAAEQVRAQAEDARRAHLAEVRALLADWRAAQERARRIESAQVPLARERSRAALAGYEGGRGDLAPVLDARRAEIETRLAHLQATTEAGRAWAQLNFLLPASTHKEMP